MNMTFTIKTCKLLLKSQAAQILGQENLIRCKGLALSEYCLLYSGAVQTGFQQISFTLPINALSALVFLFTLSSFVLALSHNYGLPTTLIMFAVYFA